jgi:flagellar M-ring protein FliF
VNQQIKAFLEKLSGRWHQLESRQKRNLALASLFFLLSVGILSWYALRPNYVVVFKDLDDSTSGEVSTKLDELKIPYQLSGNTIKVPEEYADKARVQLAMNGLPKSGNISYNDLFNNGNLGGLTENEFNVKYLAALQGSIANTIKSIDGVKNAQVLLVMPEKKLFVEQSTQDAKASVMLELQPGTSFTPKQVSGIQQLVSHSVPGLKAENVTVVDQKGIRMDGVEDSADGDGLGAEANRQLQIRHQVEDDMAKRLRNALERMVGVGNVDVVVNADISFDQTKTDETTYSSPIQGSDRGIVVSEQKTQESTEGASGNGGVVSTDQNLSQSKGQSQNTSSSDKRSQTTNYEVNKKQTETIGQPFKVNRYAVSVLVNGQPNTQTETAIKNYVATVTAGPSDNGKNPNVSVAWSTYQPPNPFQQQAFYQNPWFIGGAAVGVLLLGGGAYALARRRKEQPSAAPVLDLTVQETPEMPKMEIETEHQKMKKQIEKMAQQRPEEFVQLLRTWLADE